MPIDRRSLLKGIAALGAGLLLPPGVAAEDERPRIWTGYGPGGWSRHKIMVPGWTVHGDFATGDAWRGVWGEWRLALRGPEEMWFAGYEATAWRPRPDWGDVTRTETRGVLCSLEMIHASGEEPSTFMMKQLVKSLSRNG
jgi:hypothetical protein